MAVWGPDHSDVNSHTGKTDNAVHPRSLDCRLAFKFRTEFEEEGGSSFKVVDNDADVVHPLDRHPTQSSPSTTAELLDPGHHRHSARGTRNTGR